MVAEFIVVVLPGLPFHLAGHLCDEQRSVRQDDETRGFHSGEKAEGCRGLNRAGFNCNPLPLPIYPVLCIHGAMASAWRLLTGFSDPTKSDIAEKVCVPSVFTKSRPLISMSFQLFASSAGSAASPAAAAKPAQKSKSLSKRRRTAKPAAVPAATASPSAEGSDEDDDDEEDDLSADDEVDEAPASFEGLGLAPWSVTSPGQPPQ